jgi:ribonuclease P/MRP protein subunit POP5
MKEKKKTANGKDEKLKVLLPTLRQKKRFLRVKIISEEHFEFKELSEGVNEELLSLLGSIDFGIFGVWILRDKFDEKKQEFLLRVSIKGKEKTLSALALIDKVKTKKTHLEVLRVSGTLKGVYKED